MAWCPVSFLYCYLWTSNNFYWRLQMVCYFLTRQICMFVQLKTGITKKRRLIVSRFSSWHWEFFLLYEASFVLLARMFTSFLFSWKTREFGLSIFHKYSIECIFMRSVIHTYQTGYIRNFAAINLPPLDLILVYIFITETIVLEWITADVISHDFIINFLFEISFSVPATSFFISLLKIEKNTRDTIFCTANAELPILYIL